MIIQVHYVQGEGKSENFREEMRTITLENIKTKIKRQVDELKAGEKFSDLEISGRTYIEWGNQFSKNQNRKRHVEAKEVTRVTQGQYLPCELLGVPTRHNEWELYKLVKEIHL